MSGECEHSPDEARRIAAVRRYDVLDSPPDGAFERVTALAARLFDVPMAIVSIVDTDRIWFKSHHGLDATQTERSPGLCASAILQDGPWVLADASMDARALSNPLVAGEFGLRFYAGVPLTTHDGFNLGTLCVIDREPRETTDEQLATLTDLAALVMDELELRLSSQRAVGLQAQLRYVAEDTAWHAAWLAVAGEHEKKRERVQNILRTGAVKMVFQPIVALDTGRIFGAEALARFPGRRDKAPDAWFAEAADVSLGAELEVAAVRAALCELDRLPAETYLFVNVSPASVTSAELRRLLAEVPAGRVILELTEHTLVPNYEELDRSLSDLRADGVLVAVDDAGAGFASMQHILNLRPDVIKLDKALTHGIDEDPARRALVAALLKFGTEIGADILAEGIETEAQLASLRVLGVRYGQGYLLGEPTALPLPPSSSRGRLRPNRRAAGALRF